MLLSDIDDAANEDLSVKGVGTRQIRIGILRANGGRFRPRIDACVAIFQALRRSVGHRSALCPCTKDWSRLPLYSRKALGLIQLGAAGLNRGEVERARSKRGPRTVS